ncbi:MAG: hypothetical protein WCV72_00290 [Patescibacteria group bacterium]
MADSSSLPTTIFTFVTITIVVAIVAAFLPVNRENAKIKNGDDFRLEYSLENKPIETPVEENVFDLLQVNADQSGAKQQSNPKITNSQTNQAVDSAPVELTPSPEEFVTIAKSQNYQSSKTMQASDEELVAYKSALQTKDTDRCAAIENEVSAQNCRDEVYFQTAIVTRNIEICPQIVNERLKSRCQNYVDLIPKHEVAN